MVSDYTIISPANQHYRQNYSGHRIYLKSNIDSENLTGPKWLKCSYNCNNELEKPQISNKIR